MLGVCLVVFILSSFLPAFAANVSGEVLCERCNNFTGMHVELSGGSRIVQAPMRAPLTIDGRFHVGSVPKGEYTLLVTDTAGNILSRQSVRVSDITAPISLSVEPTLVVKNSSAEGASISVRRLSHKPPKAARKALEKSVRLTKEGDTPGAIKLLEKAVELDPEYVEALNNLGSRYILVGEYDRAIPLLNRAIVLDPFSVHPYSNLTVALMAKGDPKGAERAARQALKADPSERRARYLLGMSLFSQKKFNDETVEYLRQSQDSFPRAHVALAMAEAAMGETAQARDTLKRYLASDQKYMRPQAQEMLQRLESQTRTAAK